MIHLNMGTTECLINIIILLMRSFAKISEGLKGENMMFFKKKREKIQVLEYDREKEIPVLRCSICTGEQVAGFQNIQSGKVRDFMLIKDEQEIEKFKMMCEVSELKKIY